MDPKKESSLFDMSAQLGKSKKIESKVKPEPKPSSISKPLSPQNQNKAFSFDPDIQAMLTKMKSMHHEIELKLDEAFQRTGWNSRGIQNFLNNPNNFTNNQEWERIQQERLDLLNTIWNDLGKKGPLPAQLFQNKSKSAEQTVKERKSKTIGARRNWIPMR